MQEGVDIVYNENGVPIIEIDTSIHDSYRYRTRDERLLRVLENIRRMEEHKDAKR